MSSKKSRPEVNLEYLFSRLDTVRMTSYERARAKAILARTEAVADAIYRAIELVKRQLASFVARPVGRPTKLTG